MIDLSEVGEHVGGKIGDRTLRGVFMLDAFDKETADSGGYVISVLDRERKKRRRGEKRKPREVRIPQAKKGERHKRAKVQKPVQSVGAFRKHPGVFYFSTDMRFASYPGMACIWKAGGEAMVQGASPVGVTVAQTVVDGQLVFAKPIEVVFRDGSDVKKFQGGPQ